MLLFCPFHLLQRARQQSVDVHCVQTVLDRPTVCTEVKYECGVKISIGFIVDSLGPSNDPNGGGHIGRANILVFEVKPKRRRIEQNFVLRGIRKVLGRLSTGAGFSRLALF